MSAASARYQVDLPKLDKDLLMKCGNAGVTRRTMLARTLQAASLAAVPGMPQVELAAADDEADPSIWDAHTHLSGVAGSVEERVDRLLQYADRLAIARLVVCMGTSFVADPSPEELRRQNDQVLRAIAHAPDRVLGLVYVNPHHTQASLDELDRCVANGPMVGVKLWIALECRRRELDPIVCRAAELAVPVLQHAYNRVAGNLPGESRCEDVAELAARHPDAAFICAHTGNDWERGIRAIRPHRNVSAEICGCDPTAGFVEMAVRELGTERVIYGSDAGGRSFASQLAKVYAADLPAADRRLVLGGNLRRLLAPALARTERAAARIPSRLSYRGGNR